MDRWFVKGWELLDRRLTRQRFRKWGRIDIGKWRVDMSKWRSFKSVRRRYRSVRWAGRHGLCRRVNITKYRRKTQKGC